MLTPLKKFLAGLRESTAAAAAYLACAAAAAPGCRGAGTADGAAYPLGPPPLETAIAAAAPAPARGPGDQIREELLSRYLEDMLPADRSQVASVVARLLDSEQSGSEKSGSTSRLHYPENWQSGWTITILSDGSEVNAAATRGKQLFVWTGLLEAVRDDEELAAVLAHELAHVLEDHVSVEENGAGYSEAMELEADRIGLLLMADAGYDPKKALEFWKRIAGRGKRHGPNGGTARRPVILAGHPAPAQRIAGLESALEEAALRYDKAAEDEARNNEFSTVPQ